MSVNSDKDTPQGELGVVEFEEMMRIMLRLYIERNVESAMRITSASDPAPESCAVLASLKLIMLEMEELRALTGTREVSVKGRRGSFTVAEEVHRMNVEVKLERAAHHQRRGSLLDQVKCTPMRRPCEVHALAEAHSQFCFGVRANVPSPLTLPLSHAPRRGTSPRALGWMARPDPPRTGRQTV